MYVVLAMVVCLLEETKAISYHVIPIIFILNLYYQGVYSSCLVIIFQSYNSHVFWNFQNLSLCFMYFKTVVYTGALLASNCFKTI